MYYIIWVGCSQAKFDVLRKSCIEFHAYWCRQASWQRRGQNGAERYGGPTQLTRSKTVPRPTSPRRQTSHPTKLPESGLGYDPRPGHERNPITVSLHTPSVVHVYLISVGFHGSHHSLPTSKFLISSLFPTLFPNIWELILSIETLFIIDNRAWSWLLCWSLKPLIAAADPLSPSQMDDLVGVWNWLIGVLTPHVDGKFFSSNIRSRWNFEHETTHSHSDIDRWNNSKNPIMIAEKKEEGKRLNISKDPEEYFTFQFEMSSLALRFGFTLGQGMTGDGHWMGQPKSDSLHRRPGMKQSELWVIKPKPVTYYSEESLQSISRIEFVSKSKSSNEIWQTRWANLGRIQWAILQHSSFQP